MLVLILLATPLVGGARPALAQCVATGHNVNCTGSELNGYVNWTDGWAVTVQPEAYVYNQYNKAIEVRNNNVIVNNGDVYTQGTHHADGSRTIGGHDGIFVAFNNQIINNGTITTAPNTRTAGGVEFWGGNTLTNIGTITAQGENGFGVMMSYGGNVVNNSGTITTNGRYSIGLYFDGFSSTGGANVVNNSGTIQAQGDTNVGLMYDIGGDIFNNSGTLAATGPNSQGAVIGSSGADTLNNIDPGTINGTINMAGGNDVLTNGGTINGATGMGAGSDVLTNSGTINGAVDMGTDADTLTNSGTINGAVNMGSGDDTLALSEGASVGGVMDGGIGTDTLSFTFTVEAAEYPALASIINSATAPAGGTVTINGNVYTWVNFENLVDLLNVLAPPDDGGEPIVVEVTVVVEIPAFRDGRLNSLDFAATAILYCGPVGLDVYAVTGSGVEFAFRVDAATIQAGLTAAAAAGTPVEIAPEAARLGAHLYALDGTTLQANGPDGYIFIFSNNVCGLAG